jgi:hypothetical protein
MGRLVKEHKDQKMKKGDTDAKLTLDAHNQGYPH